MSYIEKLAEEYSKHIRIQWPKSSSGSQRTIILIYDPVYEKSLRESIDLFKQATQLAGKTWSIFDLTPLVANWLIHHNYCEEYYKKPELFFQSNENRITEEIAVQIGSHLTGETHDSDNVLALSGVGALYGFASVSEVISNVENSIQGRLLVFFPGSVRNNRYRLFNARESWNYHAIPIALSE